MTDNPTKYKIIWDVVELQNNQISISLSIDNPSRLSLGDYIEVSLNFTGLDSNWELYSTGITSTNFC